MGSMIPELPELKSTELDEQLWAGHWNPLSHLSKPKTPHKNPASFLLICLFRFCLVDLLSLPHYKSTMKAHCSRDPDDEWGDHVASVSSRASDSRSQRYPAPTTELWYCLFGGFFYSVLRPPSVWRNSKEVGQWVSELSWPRRGRGPTAWETTRTSACGLGNGAKTSTYMFHKAV